MTDGADRDRPDYVAIFKGREAIASIAFLPLLVSRGFCMWLYIPMVVVIYPFYRLASRRDGCEPIRLRGFYTFVDELFVWGFLRTALRPLTIPLRRPRLYEERTVFTRLSDAV